jgi:hypothetical protein
VATIAGLDTRWDALGVAFAADYLFLDVFRTMLA